MMLKTVQYKNGNSLAYAEYGDSSGFPVLIQHGMIASINGGQIFRRLTESGARVICTARPGYGESSPYIMKNLAEWGEIVAALVDELGLAQFDVLGISSGAPYSYAIGYTLPERARRLLILSGTPALFDAEVQAHWPYPITPHATLPELQKLAYELFFAHLSEEQQAHPDVKDSMMHDCFGIAQDLKIRCVDWGFALSQVRAPVTMRHSRADAAVPLVTAEITAGLLPDCRLEVREGDPHFSQEVLDDFNQTVLGAETRPSQKLENHP